MGSESHASIMVTCPHCLREGAAELSIPANQGDIIAWVERANHHEPGCPWIIKQGDVFERHPVPYPIRDGYLV